MYISYRFHGNIAYAKIIIPNFNLAPVTRGIFTKIRLRETGTKMFEIASEYMKDHFNFTTTHICSGKKGQNLPHLFFIDFLNKFLQLSRKPYLV